MHTDEVKNILSKNLSLKEIYISRCENNYQIIVISHIFCSMNELKRHKTIYAPLIRYILNNEIHSVSIKAYTPEEWDIKRQLYNV